MYPKRKTINSRSYFISLLFLGMLVLIVSSCIAVPGEEDTSPTATQVPTLPLPTSSQAATQTSVEQTSEAIIPSQTPRQSEPIEGLPVIAWTGHVASAPPGVQFDDYLILSPEGAGEVGLTGASQEIEDTIIELRDREGVGEYATFWGTLICPAVDFGGCQLRVTDVRYGLYQTDPEPVEGWEGTVVCSRFNAAPGEVCGNGFQLSGDFPVWYGLWSADPQILNDLEIARDTGIPIRVWGVIIAGVPDVNGTQIQLDRIQYLEEPVLPTANPTSTPTRVPPATPCNHAEFVADITVEDGTVFAPGTPFTKVWRLRNIGTCTWTNQYALIFAGGERMNGSDYLRINGVVPPGYTIDVSVNLVAPWTPGSYIGLWQLRSPDGQSFGIGTTADQPFWVNILVSDLSNIRGFDFVASACSAEWSTGARYLSCPGTGYSPDGFVIPTNNPNLEIGQEDEPTLWVHPNEAANGWITGIYPWLYINNGDHFITWVGCMAGYDRCDVTFQLDYQDGDGIVWNLGSWQEIYDSKVSKVDIDLSGLAGKNVRFIFNVFPNQSPDQAHAFWFVPHITISQTGLPIID